jgi:hypothetical protein
MQWEENQERMSSESPLEHMKKLRSLKLQGKKATASVIHQELSANGHSETLNIMLDDLLSPDKLITDSDNIEWCKWIIASGKSPNDFSTQGKNSFYRFSRPRHLFLRGLPPEKLRCDSRDDDFPINNCTQGTKKEAKNQFRHLPNG